MPQGNLNHLEMLSLYTRPGFTVFIAQQEALYRENLQPQLNQSVSDSMVEQANSPSGSGAVNQVPFDIQNVALPPLQLPIQPPQRPKPDMTQSNSYIFVPDFLTYPQANGRTDQSAVQLRSKSSIMPGQLRRTLLLHSNRIHPK